MNDILIAVGVIFGFVLLSLAVLAGMFGKIKFPTFSTPAPTPAAAGTTAAAAAAKTKPATNISVGKVIAAGVALAIGNVILGMIVQKLRLAGVQFDLWNLFLGLNLCLAMPIAMSFTPAPSSVKWLVGMIAIVVGIPLMAGINTAVPESLRHRSAVANSSTTIDLFSKNGETEIFILPGERSPWYRFQPDRKYGWEVNGLVKVFNKGTWKDGVIDEPSKKLVAPDSSYSEEERTFSFLALGKDPVKIRLWWKPNP